MKVWLDSIGQNELGNPDLILADVMEKLTAMGGNFEEKKKCLINKAKVGFFDYSLLLDISCCCFRFCFCFLFIYSRRMTKLWG